MKLFYIGAFTLAVTVSVNCAVVPMSFALERVAGGPVREQSDWAALQNLIGATNTRVDVIGVDVSTLKTNMTQLQQDVSTLKMNMTQLQQKFDTFDGQMQKVNMCSQQKMFWNGSSCVAPTTGFSRYTYYGGGGYSGAGSGAFQTNWHTLCVLASDYNSNFSLEVGSGPRADGKSIWKASPQSGGPTPLILCLD